jgi:CDP-6-deoxy-D-xylo-4-hexulose-3-dehydrase
VPDLNEKILAFLKECAEDCDGLPDYIKGPTSKPGGKYPKVLYSGPVWDEKEIAAAIESLISGKWVSSGEEVRKFERKFSKKAGVKYSLMVNSGSSANLVMIAALKKVLGWKDGDEIILSSVGFPTTLNPILQCGLTPVFVDISLEDLNWDLDQVEKAITDKTVAVFSSPVLGNPYDLDKLKIICDKHNVEMIGDSCDSLGTKWRGKDLASYFIASSCSFYPAHHITTGEGGMVSSDREEIVRTARSLAWWGRDCYCVGAANLLSEGTCGKRFDKWLKGHYDGVLDHKYYFVNVGYNLKPLDLQGAIGTVQIEKLEMIHESRRRNKQIIGSYFERINGVAVPKELGHAETSWFGVPVICDSGELKKNLVRHLETSGIQTRNYFAGNVLIHPAYRNLGDFRNYPNANQVLDRVFFVGCSPNYTDETLGYIKSVIEKF